MHRADNKKNHTTPSQDLKVSAYANLWNLIKIMNHVLYLDLHILEICVKLEDLLQLGHPHMVFLEQVSFHKLLSHIFILDFDRL